HRAGAAYAVLAAEMGRGQVVPVAQQIGERQARRDILGEVGTVEAEADAGHAQAWIIARNAATAWWLWRKSSNWRSAAPVKSAAIASRAAAWSSDPPLQRRGALARISGAPAAAPSTTRAEPRAGPRPATASEGANS